MGIRIVFDNDRRGSILVARHGECPGLHEIGIVPAAGARAVTGPSTDNFPVPIRIAIVHEVVSSQKIQVIFLGRNGIAGSGYVERALRSGLPRSSDRVFTEHIPIYIQLVLEGIDRGIPIKFLGSIIAYDGFLGKERPGDIRYAGIYVDIPSVPQIILQYYYTQHIVCQRVVIDIAPDIDIPSNDQKRPFPGNRDIGSVPQFYIRSVQASEIEHIRAFHSCRIIAGKIGDDIAAIVRGDISDKERRVFYELRFIEELVRGSQ